MAIDTGGPFLLGQAYILGKMNRKTNTIIDGNNLGSQSPQPGQIFTILSDGGGYSKNDVIYRDADNLAWLYLTMQKHDHTGDTNKKGGSFKDIWLGNVASSYVYTNNFPELNNFQDRINSGTGSGVTNDSTYGAVSVNTGTSTNGYANVALRGVPFDYAKKSLLLEKMRHVGATSSFFTRSGINAESMAVSNSNTKKFGKESCEATNGNWFVFSADGSQRSQVDGQHAIQNDVEKQTKLTNNVGSSISFEYHTEALITSKGTNLPSSGETAVTNVYSAGVKATNTTSKKYVIHGLAIIAEREGTVW